jgi:hypothetical protein
MKESRKTHENEKINEIYENSFRILKSSLRKLLQHFVGQLSTSSKKTSRHGGRKKEDRA